MRRLAVAAFPIALAAFAACTSNGDADGASPGPAGPTPNELDAGGETPSVPPDEAGSPDVEQPPAPALTVLSINLHCLRLDGTAFGSNQDRFAAIAAFVQKRGVDVLLAQEVCANASGDARLMVESALEKATAVPWSSTAAFAHRAWEGTPDEADESVALFARGDLGVPRATPHRANGALPRVMLGATVRSALGNVRVYTVHLDHADAAARLGQAREVAALATTETDDEKLAAADVLPIVAGGDFNTRVDTAPFEAMKRFGFVESSGSQGTTRIDHVFVHRSAPLAAMAAEEAFTGKDAVSDHPAVLVRFGAVTAKPAKLTRIVAKGTWPSPLAVRGDHAPFDWLEGWPAFSVRSMSGVGVVTSELGPGAFAYKFLRDDKDWQVGENVSGQGQADNASTPAFP